MTKFIKRRVKYSSFGLKYLCPRNQRRCGLLLYFNKSNPNIAVVQWDGSGTYNYLHKDFIEAINVEAPPV